MRRREASGGAGGTRRREASAGEVAGPGSGGPVGWRAMVHPLATRVIVVHHDRPAAARSTVLAFLDQQVPVRVVVVDSGSAPAALAALRSGIEGIAGAEVVDAGANVGFGPGANIGLRRWLADPDEAAEGWAVVAPHDAEPLPGCLELLIGEMAARPRSGLASAEYGPGEDFRPTVDKFFGGSFVAAPRGEGWEAVDYPHGTLLAIRREAAREVGLFDERFFAYCDEADLGMRARAAGWEVGLVWGAIVANGRPPRADVARYLQLRNTLLFLEKHFGRGPVVARLAWEVGVLASGGVGPTTGVGLGGEEGGGEHDGAERRAVRRATLLALRDYARRRFGPPPGDVVFRPAAMARPGSTVRGGVNDRDARMRGR